MKATDDTSEVVLMFRYEALNPRDGIAPDPEEGEEGDRTIVLGEVGDHTSGTSLAPPPWKGDGWRVGRTSQSCKVQAECGT